MDSILEIEVKVESLLTKKLADNELNWDKLVQSSVNLNGEGCDGILLREVENYTEKILNKLSDTKMHQIWKETENGIISFEQGFGEADRWEMIHDISLEVNEIIVDNICQESQRILKNGKKKKSIT